VTLETFFEKFDQFADAPDAVTKMRELMLQLAVQGKLVEGRENDGNAAKIFTDGRPPEAPSRYEVAENWIWIRFAAVGEQRLGKMLDQKGNRGDLKPYLRNTNVQWMRFQLDDIKELRLESEELEEFRLVPGDLLICEGGEPGRCAIWRDPDREMYFQKAIHRVRPRKGILSEYLAICLQVDAQNGVLAKHFTGATIKHFTGRSLSEYTIPLPPLAEQKRIVAKVDELMALCDRLALQQQERETRHAALARASLARFADAPTPDNLNLIFHTSFSVSPADLRKSILTLAVQGKLVPQDPNDEPAEELFAKLEKERRRFADAHKFRAPVGEPVDDSSGPFTIPTTWKWCRLSSVFNAVTDGDHLPPPKSDTGIAFLTIGNITTGTLDFEGSRLVPDSYYRGLADFRRPIRGDILYTVVGATYGRPALVESDRPFCVQRHIAILKPPQLVDVGFLMAVLRSPLAYDQASASTTGTAQPTIPLGSLRNFAVPLPPVAEQRRIVAKVEQLMALVDALEQQLAASRATAANLLSALVAELTAA
jgi:type I restriction enzyme, S subunit